MHWSSLFPTCVATIRFLSSVLSPWTAYNCYAATNIFRLYICLPVYRCQWWLAGGKASLSLIMLFASGFVLTVSSVWAVALWIELTPRMMMVMVMAKVIRQRPPPGPLWRSSIWFARLFASRFKYRKKLFPMIHKKLLGFASGDTAHSSLWRGICCWSCLKWNENQCSVHANTHTHTQRHTDSDTHACCSILWVAFCLDTMCINVCVFDSAVCFNAYLGNFVVSFNGWQLFH